MATKTKPGKRNIRTIAEGQTVTVAKVDAGGDPEMVMLACIANRIYSGILYSEESRKQYGPILVRRAIGTNSLRSIARETGLSAAYLSLVERGDHIISPASFMLLTRFCGMREELAR
jgi:hypothetical protein